MKIKGLLGWEGTGEKSTPAAPENCISLCYGIAKVFILVDLHEGKWEMGKTWINFYGLQSQNMFTNKSGRKLVAI